MHNWLFVILDTQHALEGVHTSFETAVCLQSD